MSAKRTAIAILAGGHGTRLWPLSTAQRPKQFAPILADGSMLQATFARASKMVEVADILILGSREHRDLYREQLPDLPEENLILEPQGRGTAPCIAFAAALEVSRGRFDVMVTVPADHIIADPGDWIAALEVAAEHAASNDQLVSIGSIPKAPEVKFGYLVTRERVGGTDSIPVLGVEQFAEKPDLGTLESLLSGGRCLRNMGMIAFKPDVLLDELAKFAPEIVDPLEQASAAGYDDDSIDKAYSAMPNTSIDVSVLQQTDRLSAVASRIDSIDAGDFSSIGEILDVDEHGNRATGKTVIIDSTSNTVFSDDTVVAAVGVHDLVVVVTGETVLVCPKDQSQRTKEAADR